MEPAVIKTSTQAKHKVSVPAFPEAWDRAAKLANQQINTWRFAAAVTNPGTYISLPF
ncbi:hypothetical protein D3C87_1539900 [compost metagenome]